MKTLIGFLTAPVPRLWFYIALAVNLLQATAIYLHHH